MLRISRVKNDAIWVGRNKRSGIKLKTVIEENCEHCIFLFDICKVNKTAPIVFIRYVDDIRDGKILDFG